MRQNGNKIWHIKYKRSLKLAAAMLAVSLAFPMAAQAKAWDFENGSYVDASGTPIEGAVAKGITVTKYKNRANRENGIDWGKVAADGVGFAMIRIGYYKDKDPYFDRNITEAAAHGIKRGLFFCDHFAVFDRAITSGITHHICIIFFCKCIIIF